MILSEEKTLEKTLESPLDCKAIKPVYPKGSQPWIFIGRTDVEAEAPIPWPLDAKSKFIGKDPDAGEDWGLKSFILNFNMSWKKAYKIVILWQITQLCNIGSM